MCILYMTKNQYFSSAGLVLQFKFTSSHYSYEPFVCHVVASFFPSPNFWSHVHIKQNQTPTCQSCLSGFAIQNLTLDVTTTMHPQHKMWWHFLTYKCKTQYCMLLLLEFAATGAAIHLSLIMGKCLGCHCSNENYDRSQIVSAF